MTLLTAIQAQQAFTDLTGRRRFVENRIISDLLSRSRFHGIGLNEYVDKVKAGEFTVIELIQLNQLIGYSVDGLCTLPYVSTELEKQVDAAASNGWHDISTAPLDGTEVDLFGFVDYDKIEIRVCDCEFIDGKWQQFLNGKMVDVNDPTNGIGFTPTHWRPIVKPY